MGMEWSTIGDTTNVVIPTTTMSKRQRDIAAATRVKKRRRVDEQGSSSSDGDVVVVLDDDSSRKERVSVWARWSNGMFNSPTEEHHQQTATAMRMPIMGSGRLLAGGGGLFGRLFLKRQLGGRPRCGEGERGGPGGGGCGGWTLSNLWEAVSRQDKTKFCREIETIMNVFGTTLPCNRYVVGNMVEQSVHSLLREIGVEVEHVPNAKRVDLKLRNVKGLNDLSVKFTTCGNVVVHNSLGVNRDLRMEPTLVIRLNHHRSNTKTSKMTWWLLEEGEMNAVGVGLQSYLMNKGDRLEMKCSVFKALSDVDYPYWFEHDSAAILPQSRSVPVSQVLTNIVRLLHDESLPKDQLELLKLCVG